MAPNNRDSFLIADDLKTCILNELQGTVGGVPDGFDACVIGGGTITWDNCCPGSLRVQVGRQYASERFPDIILVPSPCGVYMRATDITALILRCAPGSDQDGNPPPCDALERAAIVAAEDRDALWRAVRCCFVGTEFEYVIREVAGVGPRGQCQGVQMLLTIGLTDWCGCSGQ
jgi:hypothetical protein